MRVRMRVRKIVRTRGWTAVALLAAAMLVLPGLVLPGLVLPGLAARPAWAETMRDRQWYLSTLDVAGAHRLTTGAGVVVAVVDTGVGAHPDLSGQVLDGVAFVGTGNGQRDGSGHGTAMAGVIAAMGGSADHLLGIAPGAKILPVKVGASD